MKPIWLIRHGHHDWIGKALVGRKPGVHLNAEGRAQAEGIATRLRGEPITTVVSSPQPRAVETAEPLARALGLPLKIDARLDEIDFGAWTGMTFAELDKDSRWHEWNRERAAGTAPGGEAMIAAQRRILEASEAYRRIAPVALVSHADVIKAALVAYLNKSLNALYSLSVEPGDIARVTFRGVGPVVTLEAHEADLVAPR